MFAFMKYNDSNGLQSLVDLNLIGNCSTGNFYFDIFVFSSFLLFFFSPLKTTAQTCLAGKIKLNICTAQRKITFPIHIYLESR